MFERALNAFWILLGAATAAYAWTLGVIGRSGPESGLFPLLAALIIMAAGIVLFARRSSRVPEPKYPRGAALRRVLGVIAGLAFMALMLPYLGFAVAGALTMMVLLRTVEHAKWIESVALAVLSVAAVMFLFGNLLGMVLPRGPWGW